jgi:hypothetical protein
MYFAKKKMNPRLYQLVVSNYHLVVMCHSSLQKVLYVGISSSELLSAFCNLTVKGIFRMVALVV